MRSALLLPLAALLVATSLDGALTRGAWADDPTPAAPPTPPPANTPPAGEATPPAKGDTPPTAPEHVAPADRLPADNDLKRENLPAPPLVNGKKKRVYIIEDRFNECGGTVEAETDDYLVIETKGKLRGFYKARVSEIIPLLDPPPNQPGVVIMRDGLEYRGLIIKDEVDHVEVEVEGIRQILPRTTVLRCFFTLTPRQTYERLRVEIKPDQYTDRFKLCRYLFDQKMYEEAREELVALLEAVDMFEAKDLLRTVEAQLELGRPVTTPDDEPLTEDSPDDETPLPNSIPLPTRILSPEDVNIIRVYEIDFRKPPKMTVPQEVIRELIEKYSASELIPANAEGRAALYRAEPERLVRLMFDLRARDMYPKVIVRSEPTSLSLFRRRIHNSWLINNCATSQCHGGVDAGRFFLHRRNAKSTQVRYTNLLLLERTKIDGRPPLVDWEKPRESLVIQFGLPRSEARYPHPEVKGWKPVFGPTNRRLIDDFARWVETMYQPRPEYPVELAPPDLTAPDHSTPVDAPVVPR
ncbi:MAG: hypothetical protein JNL80_18610 [Phycisphaerae bacterium]|nr:hypothetical protein [Phycisphaerae bacterium]